MNIIAAQWTDEDNFISLAERFSTSSPYIVNNEVVDSLVPQGAKPNPYGIRQRNPVTCSDSNTIIKAYRLWDRLIFEMGIPMLIRWHIFILRQPNRRQLDIHHIDEIAIVHLRRQIKANILIIFIFYVEGNSVIALCLSVWKPANWNWSFVGKYWLIIFYVSYCLNMARVFSFRILQSQCPFNTLSWLTRSSHFAWVGS